MGNPLTNICDGGHSQKYQNQTKSAPNARRTIRSPHSKAGTFQYSTAVQEERMRVRSTILGSLLIFTLLVSTAVFSENNLPVSVSAAVSTSTAAAADPLLQLLVTKGVLNAEDAKSLVGTQAEQRAKLLELLLQKGVLSVSDYDALATPVQDVSYQGNSGAHVMNAVMQSSSSSQSSQAVSGTPPPSPGPGVIPAVAPLRVMPLELPKQAGMIPDFKLGSGVNLKLYGFFKASAVSDTASSGGPTFGSQDWPLPLLLADTGPTSDPQVHIKARQFRIGAQGEWVPKNSDFTLTGRVEGDFEGDYTDVNNRNISGSARSQFSLRLAWMRVDHKIGDVPWFAEFGEDWSLLGSSTLPSLFETTGLGVGMGSLYERMPQFKTGVQFHSGDFKVQPEFAIVMATGGSSALTVDQRLRFGDRVGAESNQPGVEARIVFQYPLNHHWKGVAPAELIFSGHHARMNEIIPHAKQVIPTDFTCTVLPCVIPPFTYFTNVNSQNVGFSTTTKILNAGNCGEPGGSCNLEQIYGTGTQVGNPQNIWTTEVQLPTPWVTFVAKYYKGDDMRFFFGGQLNDVYNNLVFPESGVVGTGISESGRSITFGCASGISGGAGIVNCQGSPVTNAILQPVGGSGGFAELSFPLSRIFNANPEGHNSGWILHLGYGTDRAKYSDARKTNNLGRTDLDTASLTYRLNKWVTFVHEASYIATHTAQHELKLAPLFEGRRVFQAHNWRNEFGPVFTF